MKTSLFCFLMMTCLVTPVWSGGSDSFSEDLALSTLEKLYSLELDEMGGINRGQNCSLLEKRARVIVADFAAKFHGKNTANLTLLSPTELREAVFFLNSEIVVNRFVDHKFGNGNRFADPNEISAFQKVMRDDCRRGIASLIKMKKAYRKGDTHDS